MTKQTPAVESFNIVILGGGCAGMSLAYRLMLAGYSGTVIVLERSATFGREQRWCSWGPIEPKIMPFVSEIWEQFIVRGPDKQFRLAADEGYYQVAATDFLDGIQKELFVTDNFFVRQKTEVISVTKSISEKPWMVQTESGCIVADMVFDGRNLIDKSILEVSGEPWLTQSFAGQIVTARKDVFDHEAITLMDFDVPDGEAGAFVYVLPYSERTALIESTVVSADTQSIDEHLRRVNWYVQNRIRTSVTTTAIEHGTIPMTTTKFPFELDDGLYAIGIMAGAAKPSTGYSFARIQRQSQQIADDIVKLGKPGLVKPNATELRRMWLDDVFITAAAANETFFVQTVLRMFEKLPPELLIRFLSESDTIADGIKVIGAVGNLDLAIAAVSRKWG